MPIKYGELTVIHNMHPTNVFGNISLWLGIEPHATKATKFVFLFEDGDIRDADDVNATGYTFRFIESGRFALPIYFRKKSKDRTCYFFKHPLTIDGKFRVDFKPLFSAYAKFNSSVKVSSNYNGTYYSHQGVEPVERFGIVRINSGESMPRFLFAYESDEFTKEEVIEIIYRIFVDMKES
jgi:hypothetical protein